MTSTAQGNVDTVVSGASMFVTEQCRRRPYATLGTAAAVGYVLGGGLPRIFVSAAVGAGVRYALGQVFSELLGSDQTDST